MALKRKTERQQRIAGTFDPPVEAVQEAAEKYVELLMTRMQTQEEENAARRELIEVMVEHDVMECETECYKVNRVHLEEDKVKVKKIDEKTEE
jgi:hypothetical protein